MHISYLFGAVAALAAVASGQSDTTSYESSSRTATWTSTKTGTSSTTTSSSGPATISISVGAEGFVFTPKDTKAKVGDTLSMFMLISSSYPLLPVNLHPLGFVFYPGGHSVARADFKFPCIPYEYAGVHRTGFWSGTMTPQVATGSLWYDVKVNDTDPIFYYCAAPGSCKDHHMIGVVNPTANWTFDAQMAYAEKVQFQLKPGDPWPSETAGEQPSETQSSGYGSSDDASPNPNPDSQKSDSDDHPHLSPGAIAGIAIGGAAVLVLAAALIYICGRRGGFDKAYRKSAGTPLTSPPVPQGPMAEGNYAGVGIIPSNPKSPGQSSFSTYPGAADQESYRSLTTSPQQPYYNAPYNGTTPPPLGGVHQGYPVYQTAVPPQGVYSPPGELSAHRYA